MTRLRVLFRRTWRRTWWKLRHPRTPYRVTINPRDVTIQQLYASRADDSLGRLARLPSIDLDPEVTRLMRERIEEMQDRAILGTPPRRVPPRERFPWEPATERPRWVEPPAPEQPVWARLGGFGMGYGGQDAINPFLFAPVVPGDSPAITPSAIPPAPEVNNYDPPCSGPSYTDCSVASDSAGAVGGAE